MVGRSGTDGSVARSYHVPGLFFCPILQACLLTGAIGKCRGRYIV